MREAARQDDDIGAAKAGVLVPDEAGGMTQQAHGVDGILVAVRSGKL